MNEKLNSNKLLIIFISVVIVIIVVLLAAYMYIISPKTVLLRSINNVQKFFEQKVEQNITKGKITTNIDIIGNTEVSDNYKLNNINLNTISQIDDTYTDLKMNIKYGDMNLPEILMVITNNNVYAKVSELSKSIYLIGQIEQNRNLSKKAMTDIVKILVNSLFELNVVKTKEVISIDGTKIKCTKSTIAMDSNSMSSFLTSVKTKINKNKELLEELNQYAKRLGYNDINSIIETYKKGNYGVIELSIYSKGLGGLVKVEEKTISETIDTYSISFAGEKLVLQNNEMYTIIDYSDTNDSKGNLNITCNLLEKNVLKGTISYAITKSGDNSTNTNITVSYTKAGEDTNTINITSNSVIDKKAEIIKVDVTSAKDIKDLTSDEKNEIMGKIFSYMMKNSSLNGLDGDNTNIESQLTIGQAMESEIETVKKADEAVKSTNLADIQSIVSLKYATDMARSGGQLLLYSDAEEYSQTCAIKYIKEIMRHIFEENADIDLTKYKFILEVKKSDYETYICEARLKNNSNVSVVYKLNDKTVEVNDELIVTGRVVRVSVEQLK